MKNKFLSSIIFSLIVMLSASSGLGQQRSADKSQKQTVSLQNLDGSTLTVGNLKGKVTILAIGATWLPLSKQQAIIVNQLQQSYGKRDVAIYFVSTDASDVKSKNYADNAKIKSFGERNKISTAILRDTEGTTMKFYNLDQIPAFVILNKDGEIAGVVTGLGTEEDSTKNTVAQISAQIDKVL
ncbi:MAG: TlpA disulfide reductase family protein [Pyrinomonadaceae bacterium]